jgi:hypothetical protein
MPVPEPVPVPVPIPLSGFVPHRPAAFSAARSVVHVAPPLVTAEVQRDAMLPAFAQQGESNAQSGFVDASMPGPAGLLELLQAAAAMEAAKMTGMARRYRFMAGQHTRASDQVKKLSALCCTKTRAFRRRGKDTVSTFGT